MASDEIRSDGVFGAVDIRDVPDDELDDLMGGGVAPMVPMVKAV
jgi:hypothetical protein